MPKYTEEIKNNALAMMSEKGVKATSEELKINTMTLYKWRREIEGDDSANKTEAKQKAEELLNAEMLAKDKRIEKLEAEAVELRQTISELESKVNAFRKTTEILLK